MTRPSSVLLCAVPAFVRAFTFFAGDLASLVFLEAGAFRVGAALFAGDRRALGGESSGVSSSGEVSFLVRFFGLGVVLVERRFLPVYKE